MEVGPPRKSTIKVPHRRACVVEGLEETCLDRPPRRNFFNDLFLYLGMVASPSYATPVHLPACPLAHLPVRNFMYSVQ